MAFSLEADATARVNPGGGAGSPENTEGALTASCATVAVAAAIADNGLLAACVKEPL